MNRFFGSEHCVTRAHCRKCRDKEGGRGWRESLRVVFADVSETDFECPHGVEWGAGKQERRAAFRDEYERVVNEIRESGGAGIWGALKVELAAAERHIAHHPEMSRCWVQRQRKRLMDFYETAKKKWPKQFTAQNAL